MFPVSLGFTASNETEEAVTSDVETGFAVDLKNQGQIDGNGNLLEVLSGKLWRRSEKMAWGKKT